MNDDRLQIVITLSPENTHPGMQTVQDLLWFIVNELESADIGAYVTLQERVCHE